MPTISFLDETQAVEDFTQDSDDDSDGQDVLGSLSSASTPKPSLRSLQFSQPTLSYNPIGIVNAQTLLSSVTYKLDQPVRDRDSSGMADRYDMSWHDDDCLLL